MEVAFALAVIVGLTFWVISNRRDQAAHAPKPANSLNVVTTAPIKLGLAYVTNGFTKITSISHINGDGRLYVTEQPGLIKVIKDGVLQPQPFLDLTAKVRLDSEMGLLGLAFDPNFATTHYVFVFYSAKQDGADIVARYTVSADGTVADPASAKIVLQQAEPFPNHNGGQLAFGPEGYLYIGIGDGGSAGDPQDNAQNLGTWLGKILRIDVHTGDPYSAPADNPFVKTAGAKPEIWDFGLRNPWRFSFDSAGKQLVIADVGQGTVEEVDTEAMGKGGNNYGWRCFEGEKSFNAAKCKEASAYVAPRLTYTHDKNRCSITGGYVYNGSRLAGYGGRYVYADYCTGEIFSVDLANKNDQPQLEIATHFTISTFGEDNDHNLYTADYGAGIIYKLSQIY